MVTLMIHCQVAEIRCSLEPAFLAEFCQAYPGEIGANSARRLKIGCPVVGASFRGREGLLRANPPRPPSFICLQNLDPGPAMNGSTVEFQACQSSFSTFVEQTL